MILIFSGYNQRAVIAFLRTLKNNKITDYSIVASSSQDSILNTEYAKNIFFIRQNNQLDLKEICNLLDQIYTLKKGEKVLLVPTSEALNRFFLRFRSVLEEHHSIIPLVNKTLYSKLSDKQNFWELCRQHGFKVPNQTDKIEDYHLPLVAKPKKYASENGEIFSPIIIQSKKELHSFRQEYPINDFIFQEFVSGKSYYLLYYFAKNDEVYCLSQRNLAQQPNGKSMIAACVSMLHKKKEIAKQYEQMLKKVGFHGFIMIELRNTKDDYYMIEANPRFWGPSQLFCDSGFNFFEFFLYDYGFLDKIPDRQINYDAKYLWSGGIKGKLLDNDNCVWLEGGKEYVQEHIQEFLASDIFNRSDTIEIYKTERNENQIQN